jgi:hypothetical protein
MTTAMAQMVRSHLLMFLGLWGVTFLVLGAIAFTVPKQLTVVRTSIDVSYVEIADKQTPLEAPEQVVRRIARVYGAVALSDLKKAGASPQTIAELGLPDVEVAGLTLLIVNTVDLRIENETKAFQQSIANQIIKAQAPRVLAIHRALEDRITATESMIDTMAEQIAALSKEIENIDGSGTDLGNQIEQQQSSLTKLEQSAGESSTLDARLRLRETISKQGKVKAELAVQRSRLTLALSTIRRGRTQQMNLLAETQSEKKTLTEARMSLPPLSLPLTTGSRRLGMLFIAFVASILLAFGTMVLLHKVVPAKG